MASLPDGWRRTHEEWAAIRAELVAEQCKNCVHWSGLTTLGRTRPGLAECVLHEIDACNDDFCSHFTKKGPTP
jgi:hypothetical protein